MMGCIPKNEKPWVHLIAQTRYNTMEIAEKIRKVIHSEKIEVKNKIIALKPSFVFPFCDFERVKAINTHQTLVAAVAGVLVEKGAKKVLIVESETGGSARFSFQIVQMKRFLKIWSKEIQNKIECVYLDECLHEWVSPSNSIIPGIKLDYPTIMKEVDLFITLPKLKVNTFAKITLSVKNGMGLISKNTRLRYHGAHLHEMISDLFMIRPPDYCITDAVFAGEGQGPMSAKPYPMNLIIMGNNALAVDSVCCHLMGYDPKEIQHLVYLNERNYGPLQLDKINLYEIELFKSRIHPFIRPEKNLHQLSQCAPHLHVFKGETDECGCAAFLQMLFDFYGLEEGCKGWNEIEEEIYLIYGKDVKVPENVLKDPQRKKRNTIIYGDEAKEYAKYGVFWPSVGEVPDYMDFLFTASVKTGLPISPVVKKSKKYALIWPTIQQLFVNKKKTLKNYL